MTGSQLVWDFTGVPNILFSASDTSTRSLGPDIEVKLLSIYNGVVRSMATVNSTSAINGTTLQCRNQVFPTGSVREEVDFSVLSKLHFSSGGQYILLIQTICYVRSLYK